MKKIQFPSFTWIDINPEIQSDIDNVDTMINLEYSTEQILKSSIHLQRLEEFPDYMAVVLHYPLYDKKLRKNTAVEIDCILTKGYFITSHIQDLHFLTDIMTHIEGKTSRFNSPVELYVHIVSRMLHSCMTPLNRIAEKIDFIEEEIFKGNEKHMISEISIVKRDVLDFRKTIRLHKSIIDSSFKLVPIYFPDNPIRPKSISDIMSSNIHIWNITENLKEAIEAFDQTNQTLYILYVGLIITVIYAIVFITEGQRNIPISYSKKSRGSLVNAQVDTYLPLKVNQAGVMPIIFAVSLVLFPQVLASILQQTGVKWLISVSTTINSFLSNQVVYASVYFILVLIFTYVYTTIVFEPKAVAENLQKQGGFVTGIRPGEKTAQYLQYVSNRIILFGAIFLGIIAVLPFIVTGFTGNQSLAIGGTSLLIVVSVILETMKQIESQIIVRDYDSL